ncbi:membrane protein [Advenella kashmirensis W13003]|uniref:Membrane protein n=1 Tax=Advenella kashmirensis W13003 TaxID=1424334 RepID=V8QUD2_9BURK|nr:membrane protein [Advenella kashmirensis W13003]
MPDYERIALVLQGGGALGAYQAGVFEGLQEAGIEPNWISGISIGALNTAIIAGNPPARRAERLHEFWNTICQSNNGFGLFPWVEQSLFRFNDLTRSSLSALYGMSAIMDGQNGFFTPRFPPPSLYMKSNVEQVGFYDMSPLRETLERLCDFDLINSGHLNVSVGAVNVRNGNFTYFCNERHHLTPAHFMASGALPPAFAPVQIDGEYYWDGGIMSNTPLGYVLDAEVNADTLVFQVDLWSARGHLPDNMLQVYDRVKEIQYSSRTRLVTNQWARMQRMRNVMAKVLEQLPDENELDADTLEMARAIADSKHCNVIQLIYRDREYESYNKDYQFGMSAMRDHWKSGLKDIRNTLSHPDYLAMPDNDISFMTHDIHRAQSEARRKRKF